jgi:hypothetical protein
MSVAADLGMTRPRIAPIRLVALVVLASLAAGCGDADEQSTPERPSADVSYLSPLEHLARASMALRGMRPTVQELEAVAADPSALEGIVDGYLQSPAFGKVIRDLHNEALLSRVDYFYYPAGFPAVGALATADLYHLNRSLQEASLRLIEHVVMNNRPYGEIVTADYYLANDVVAEVWGSLDVVGPDWQVTHWKDARPKAGILSDPWLFTRYQSTQSNKNRGRANALSKALICYDFLSRDIEIDASINLADPAVVDDAVVKNPACASCHQALDPLASYFADYFPLVVAQQFTTYPFSMNFPIEGGGGYVDFYFEGIGSYYYGEGSLREPSYFGQAAASVADLGRVIAEDPRFSLCATKRFYSYLHQIDLEDVDLEAVAGLQQRFIESGLDAKALAKAVVLDDAFRISHSDDEAEAEELVGVLKIRPDQLGSMIDDLTGFRWQLHPAVALGQVDLLDDSFVGFQVLGGGIDSAFVTKPAHTFNATSSLVLEAVAAEAAAHVVASDAKADPSARRLFAHVDPKGGTEEQIRQQLSWLHARLFAEWVSPASAEVDESYALYASLLQHGGDPARAWEGTLAAMLQDIRIATY